MQERILKPANILDQVIVFLWIVFQHLIFKQRLNLERFPGTAVEEEKGGESYNDDPTPLEVDPPESGSLGSVNMESGSGLEGD